MPGEQRVTQKWLMAYYGIFHQAYGKNERERPEDIFNLNLASYKKKNTFCI